MGFPYRVVKSDRQDVQIEITGGQVVVHCPRGMQHPQIAEIVREKTPWIESQLHAVAQQTCPPPLTPEQLRQLANQAVIAIPQRVRHFGPIIGVTWKGITIRSQKTRWGSCTSLGNLNFNCLLMLVPPEVMDYVVIHELCHRIHMNHGPQFWAEVEKYDPQYLQHRQWLKVYGSALVRRLP